LAAVVEVVDGGTVTTAAVVATAELVAAATAVVDGEEARRDDSAAEGFSEPEQDARPRSTSGNRIRKERIQNGNRLVHAKEGAARFLTYFCGNLRQNQRELIAPSTTPARTGTMATRWRQTTWTLASVSFCRRAGLLYNLKRLQNFCCQNRPQRQSDQPANARHPDI
jgi:hypothetical protein